MSINRTYETTDLNLATTLSLFFPIESIEKHTTKGKAVFVFQQSKELLDLTNAFWNGNLKVSAVDILNQLKVVKSRLYAS